MEIKRRHSKLKFQSIFHNFCSTIIGIILFAVGGIGILLSRNISIAFIPLLAVLSGLFLISIDWEGR